MKRRINISAVYSQMIKGFSCLVLFLTFSTMLFGQSVLIDPTAGGGFELPGNLAANGWTVAQAGQLNQWYNGPAVPAGNTTTSAFISNNGGVTHQYGPTPFPTAHISHIYQSVTFPAGETNISLTFDMIGIGEDYGPGATYDFLYISISPVAPAAGAFPAGGLGFLANVGAWSEFVINLPCAGGYAGTTQNLVFTWVSDYSVENQPPAAIDNVSLVSHDNFSCATAETITIGAADRYNTTKCGDPPSAAGCLWLGSECTWYEFVATATQHAVLIEHYDNGGYGDPLCAPTSAVYEGSCAGPLVACQHAYAFNNAHYLTNLTIGAKYYIEICFDVTDPWCFDLDHASFGVQVTDIDDPLTGLTGTFDEICDACDDLCGDALVYPFAIPPSIPTVVADCGTSTFNPPLTGGTVNSYCNAFVTPVSGANIDVNFQNIVTSNCGAGNVLTFDWELYTMGPCSATPVQTGDLSDLIFDNLLADTEYAYCYTITVPYFCEHDQHCPYVYGEGIQVFLPIELLQFTANRLDNNVEVSWTTASEVENALFSIERSRDDIHYEVIGTLPGAGNSSSLIDYSFFDTRPVLGTSYYRLRQTDFDGTQKTFPPVAVDFNLSSVSIALFRENDGMYVLESNSFGSEQSELSVIDVLGSVVQSRTINLVAGVNRTSMDLSSLRQGVYHIRLTSPSTNETLSFMKE